MISNEDIVMRILELNKKKGWSIYQLAKESGISYSTLNHIITKNSIPKLETFRKICESLDLTPNEFLGYGQLDGAEMTENQAEVLKIWSKLDCDNREFARKFISFLLIGQE